MNINNTIAGAASASAAGGSSASSGAGSATIGDQFMKMLVAQLKNQDPLNPMDPTAMTAQLTQLNSLQQLESINTTLAKMGGGAALGSALAEASTAVGKHAQLGLAADGGLAFHSADASVHFDFGGAAPFAANLVAKDANGTRIGSWKLDGSIGDIAIGKLPEGATLNVDAVYGNGQPDTQNSGAAMLSQNMQVKGVALSGGAAYLVDPSGQRAAWATVVGLD
jgi:hypothetical protein